MAEQHPDHIDAPRGALRDAEPTEQSELDRLSTEYREVD
ncbi:hypothetical protein DFQ14_11370 [Halopolyspora algeriensis]|uniref:Uncharacterized protein n=1 Tax=Halopolyspora algeriensis TaxID=1500506 RepID=A0A368VK08_9ACTN|nr:hypothetical protein DFQ14_11370 [Halopolyspora algeriensis]TQM46575.1 hypothetical protein FHU43_3692 [Halopolyspora algeriensis]